MILNYIGSEIYAPTNKSYQCARSQVFNVMEENTQESLSTITFSHLRLEAFRKINSNTFNKGMLVDLVTL